MTDSGADQHSGTGNGGKAENDRIEESLRRAAADKQRMAAAQVDRELENRFENRSVAPPVPARSRFMLPSTINFLAFVVGAGAGVAQLGGFGSGPGKIILTGIGITSLLLVVVRARGAYFGAETAQLREQLAVVTEERADYRLYNDAIARINERERPLFAETIDLTVRIGEDDDSDRITERRVTVPKPLVAQRTIRPIVPTNAGQVTRFSDLRFEARRDDGEITPILLRERENRIRVWLVFDPAMTETTEWELVYHPHALWRPLRQHGWDELVWDDRLPSGDNPSAFTTFMVRFSFPTSGRPPSVSERNGHGESLEPALTADGRWEVLWQDPRPAGRRYIWDLSQKKDS